MLKTELLPQASPRSPPPPAPAPSRNLLPTGTGTAWAVPTPRRAGPRATAPAGTQPPKGAAGPRGSQEALQGWAGVDPGVHWDPQTQHVTMQNLPTVPQDGAAPALGAAGPHRVSTQSHRVVQDQHPELQDHAGSAPSATEPCRTCQQRCRAVQDQHPAPQGHGGSSTQCHGAMQDPQMMLRGHAGPVFATARPHRACNQHCRACSTCTQGLWGHAGPTASTVDPCRTHSWWHGAVQDLQQCCRAMQDPQCPPCSTQDAQGHASPTDRVVGPCRLTQHQAGPVPGAVALCHPVPSGPGSEREPKPGAGTILPRHLRSLAKPGPAVPPPRPPAPAQLPTPPCTHRGAPKPLVAPGGRGGGGAPRPPLASPAAVGPSTSERPGRGSLPLASTPQRALPPEPAPFTVREETATGRDPPGASPRTLAPVPAPLGPATPWAPGLHRAGPRGTTAARPVAPSTALPAPARAPLTPRLPAPAAGAARHRHCCHHHRGVPAGTPVTPSGAGGHPTRGTEGTRSLQTMHGQGSDGPAAAVTLPGSHPGSPGHRPPAASPAPRM